MARCTIVVNNLSLNDIDLSKYPDNNYKDLNVVSKHTDLDIILKIIDQNNNRNQSEPVMRRNSNRRPSR